MTMPSVLVIDDEPTLTKVMCAFIGSALPGVVTCVQKNSGADALEFLADESTDVRLVFVDLQLEPADMDGRELIRRIVVQRPDLRHRIVVCTGEPLSEDDTLFSVLGCGRLEKPFELEELRGLVVGAVTNG
jgi:CheY-like chemotaxis protein